MRQPKENNLLTEVELEFMTILWRLKKATVRDILDNLAEGRALAYTSAATIMRILEKKKFATSEKIGKTYYYIPNIDKEPYQLKSLQDISKKLFDDAPLAVVTRLVEDENVSEEMLLEIRQMLDKKLDEL